MQRYNFTKKKHSNKKVKKLEESRVISQRFHLYFHRMLFTNNCYYFDLKNQYASAVLSPLTGDNQWTKCYYLFWLALMTHGIQNVSMDLCVFSQPGAGSEISFVPLNSVSVRLEYNQILQSHLGEQGGVLQILINKPTNMMCSCYEKIRLGQTEESPLSGKTHIRTR